MPAKKGNKYAEKWTKEATLEKLREIELLAEDESCLWLGSALKGAKMYREIWSYWTEKFKEDQEVFQTIKRIDQIFEDRVFTEGARGNINPTMAIFALKNNHHWTDKVEQTVNLVNPVIVEDDL